MNDCSATFIEKVEFCSIHNHLITCQFQDIIIEIDNRVLF